MFSLKFISYPRFPIDEKKIDSIRKNISKLVTKPQKWTLNIMFVNSDSIKNLNKNYRKKDYVTDVLSFHYFKDFSLLKTNDIAGEIVMCEEKIISQWTEFWLGEEKEFYKLLIHSMLHILGFDHENENEYQQMQRLEDAVWKKIF